MFSICIFTFWPHIVSVVLFHGRFNSCGPIDPYNVNINFVMQVVQTPENILSGIHQLRNVTPSDISWKLVPNNWFERSYTNLGSNKAVTVKMLIEDVKISRVVQGITKSNFALKRSNESSLVLMICGDENWGALSTCN